MPEPSSKLGRHEWVDRYVAAFTDHVNGQADLEDLLIQGSALYCVNGDTPPEAIARTHFENCSAVERTLPMLRAAALGMAGATTAAMPGFAGAGGVPAPPPMVFDTRAPLAANNARASGSITVQGDTININITAAPGTDANALASAVRAELDRRESAKNARMRATFIDYDN